MATLQLGKGDYWTGIATFTLPKDIEVKPGVCIGVFAPSRARTSEFLRLVGGQLPAEVMQPPPPGRVRSELIPLHLEKLPVYFKGDQLYESANRVRCIGYVDSDPDCLLGRTVVEEYFSVMAARKQELNESLASLELRPFGLNDKLSRETNVLSGGEKQRLAVAGALTGRSEMLVADLSASNLDQCFIDDFIKWTDKYCANNGCVMVAGLRPDEFKRYQPGMRRYLVLENSDSARISVTEKREWELSREAFPEGDAERDALTKQFTQRTAKDEVLVALKNVSRKNITPPVTFELREGEVVRLQGENGSGKTTIGNILTGRIGNREVSGELEVAKGVHFAMALQFPGRTLLAATVRDELPEEHLRTLCGLSKEEERAAPRDLDFGTRKLLAIASALAIGERGVILDEPTAGMDFPQKKRFIDLLNCFSTQAILLITHDTGLEQIGRCVEMPREEVRDR